MSSAENRLLEKLPGSEQRLLAARCERVILTLGQILSEHGQPVSHVYFPSEGFISMVTRVDGHPGLEVGMVGNEGMVGAQLALGVPLAPIHTVVQGAGSALRMSSALFRKTLKESPSLTRGLHRYLYVLMAQLTTSAACLRFHQIGHRLARWLLMSQDRAHSDHFQVTHEFLAYMLGVRRVGITTAAAQLQRAQLIDYRRGAVSVIDRVGLESHACSCYAVDLEVYRRVIR